MASVAGLFGARRAQRKRSLREQNASSAQQVGAEDGAAAFAEDFNGDVARVHQPLQAVAVNQRADGGGGVLGADAAELLQLDALADDLRVALAAPGKEFIKEFAEAVGACAKGDEIKKHQIKLAIDFRAVEQQFQLRCQALARRFLAGRHLVQAAGEFAQQPIEHGEKKIILAVEIMESSALAGIGTGHHRIEGGGVQALLKNFGVTRLDQSFAASFSKLGIDPAMTHGILSEIKGKLIEFKIY